MASNKRSTAVGVFADRFQAEQAAEELRQAGFRNNQIQVLVPDKKLAPNAKQLNVKTKEYEVVEIPGMLGTPTVLVADATDSSKQTNVKTITKKGEARSILIGMGVPDRAADFFEQQLLAGRVLVTVKNQRRYDQALAILSRLGTAEMGLIPEGETVTTPPASRTAEAKARKGAATGHRTVDVPVTHEEVVGERPPVRGRNRKAP
jgi:Heat induced stress protein YflT